MHGIFTTNTVLGINWDIVHCLWLNFTTFPKNSLPLKFNSHHCFHYHKHSLTFHQIQLLFVKSIAIKLIFATFSLKSQHLITYFFKISSYLLLWVNWCFKPLKDAIWLLIGYPLSLRARACFLLANPVSSPLLTLVT